MKISFHGAAHTVTGSQHLIEVNGSKILLDCGIYQGRRQEAYQRNRTFKFDPATVDAVLLSHAHIDHSGNLPNLVKNGFTGSIHATKATSHLAELMLLDSGHIQESDAAYVNKKRARRGEAPIEPIYTQEDAAQVASYFKPEEYGYTVDVAKGVRATFVEAGHILGSAAIALDIEEHGRKFRLWFSGDIGRYNLPLLRDPVLPSETDYLLMECTYGDKPHRDPHLAFEELREVVKQTIDRGGKIIIPAFAVGRTQELVFSLHKMTESGDIPRIPIYVDSPLAVNASDIFNEHPEVMDAETHAHMRTHGHAALDFDQVHYTRSVDESKALNTRKDPMVIISASGMAETGRILHHLKNNIEDKRNTILIVSWQAPYTLGRRLAEREKEIKIFGEWYDRKAEVATIGGLSAHAGQDLLTKYALSSKNLVKKIFLVHGEEKAAQAFSEHMKTFNMDEIYYPELHDTVEI